MNEAPSNQWPVNQAALRWLQEGRMSPLASVSYLAQLAAWGLEKNVVSVPRPTSPSQPERHSLQSAVESLLGDGPQEALHASQWFLSNPNLDEQEQAESLARQLQQAKDPPEAAQIAVETAYDLMVAESANSPE